MRSRPPLAVLAMGLAITSCTSSDSAAVETLASTIPTIPTTINAASEGTEPDAQAPGALLVTVEVDGRTTVADSDGTTTASGPDSSVTTTSTIDSSSVSTTASTASTASTGATAATSQPTTTAPPTTQPTTAPTTAPPATATGTETRPEILRLDLPTFGGATFDPNSVAGRNVILWFWGAH